MCCVEDIHARKLGPVERVNISWRLKRAPENKAAAVGFVQVLDIKSFARCVFDAFAGFIVGDHLSRYKRLVGMHRHNQISDVHNLASRPYNSQAL